MIVLGVMSHADTQLTRQRQSTTVKNPMGVWPVSIGGGVAALILDLAIGFDLAVCHAMSPHG